MCEAMGVKITSEGMDFRKKVEDLSGEMVSGCFQCGGCAASCPMRSEMDLLPPALIRLIQLGQREVLESKTIWLCSSCFVCNFRCPRGLDVSKIMEALRQMNLRRNIDYANLQDIPREDLKRLPQVALVSCLRKFTA